MTSNAYIASDGEKLMKVGKANNPKRREKQIDLTITLTVACLDEVSAFRIEDQLRQFVIERGGIKHAKTVDWFVFDPQIYRMVCEFAANLEGFIPLSDEDSQEAEIAVFRQRYFQLLLEESNAAAEVNPLKVENDSLRAEIQKLQREKDYLQQEQDRLRKAFEVERERYREEIKTEREQNRERFWEALDWEGKYIELRSYVKTLGCIDEDTDI